MLILAMVCAALGGTPVVFDGGDGPTMAARVAERTGLPPSQLEPVALSELFAADPQVLGAAAMRHCTRDRTTNEQIRTLLVRAENAWAERDRGSAMDKLDLAVAELGCLGELVDAPVAARVFLLRSALAMEREAAEEARTELRTALALHPEVPWVDSFPGERMQFLLEEERVADTATGVLRVVPPSSQSGPWLDGRIPEAKGGTRLAAGLHLAQYSGAGGIHSAWLVFEKDASLVLPGYYRRPVLEHMVEPDGTAEVEALLAAALPDLQAAYVTHWGGLWLVTSDATGTATTQIAEATPPPPPEPEPEGRKKRKRDKKR